MLYIKNTFLGKEEYDMPINEKEYNGNLFDKLELVERIRREANRGGLEAVLEQLDIEEAAINRKLYQNPPLVSE